MATLGDIILDVETNLSMMGGIDVQTYAQPRIVLAVNQAFSMFFGRKFWKRHRAFTTRLIDPTTGYPTVAVPAGLSRYTDIQYVWADGAPRPLTELPNNVNPESVRGNTLMSDPIKVLRVLPLQRIKSISILYRSRPVGRFVETDEVPFDDLALCYQACALMTISDGANMALAKYFQSEADKRINMLLSAEMGDRSFSPATSSISEDSGGWSNSNSPENGMVNYPDYIVFDENNVQIEDENSP